MSEEQSKLADLLHLSKVQELQKKSTRNPAVRSKSIDTADPANSSIFKRVDDSLLQMVQRYSRGKLKKENEERICNSSASKKELIGTNFWKDPEIALGEIMKVNEKEALESFKSRSKSILLDPYQNVAKTDIKFLKKKVVNQYTRQLFDSFKSMRRPNNSEIMRMIENKSNLDLRQKKNKFKQTLIRINPALQQKERVRMFCDDPHAFFVYKQRDSFNRIVAPKPKTKYEKNKYIQATLEENLVPQMNLNEGKGFWSSTSSENSLSLNQEHLILDEPKKKEEKEVKQWGYGSVHVENLSRIENNKKVQKISSPQSPKSSRSPSSPPRISRRNGSPSPQNEDKLSIGRRGTLIINNIKHNPPKRMPNSITTTGEDQSEIKLYSHRAPRERKSNSVNIRKKIKMTEKRILPENNMEGEIKEEKYPNWGNRPSNLNTNNHQLSRNNRYLPQTQSNRANVHLRKPTLLNIAVKSGYKGVIFPNIFTTFEGEKKTGNLRKTRNLHRSHLNLKKGSSIQNYIEKNADGGMGSGIIIDSDNLELNIKTPKIKKSITTRHTEENKYSKGESIINNKLKDSSTKREQLSLYKSQINPKSKQSKHIEDLSNLISNCQVEEKRQFSKEIKDKLLYKLLWEKQKLNVLNRADRVYHNICELGVGQNGKIIEGLMEDKMRSERNIVQDVEKEQFEYRNRMFLPEVRSSVKNSMKFKRKLLEQHKTFKHNSRSFLGK